MDQSPYDNNPVCFLDEGTADESPSFHHYSHCHDSSFTPESLPDETVLSPDASPLVSRSPASTWAFSPPCTPSHAPLLYHCISSLCRDGNIYSVAVSRGVVFTGSSSACIRAWQPLGCCEKGNIQASSGEVRAMLTQGDMLFTSHKDHKIRVWSIVSSGSNFNPRKITTLPKPSPLRFWKSKTSSPQHKDTVSCMAYNHTDGLLYTGSWDKTVKAWRLSDRKCLDSFAAHADNINDMVINQDGYLFTCSSDGTIKMWSRACGETFHTLTMTLSFHPFPIYALALSKLSPSQRNFLYSGSSDGCINFWERQISGGYSHCGYIHAHQFAILCLAALGNVVISGSADATIRIWKREEGELYHECLAVLEGHKGPVKCLAVSLEKERILKGFLVFSASLDRTFKVWRVKILLETKKARIDHGDGDEINYGKYQECETSTVLSPSWVKKVQHGS